MEARVPGMLPKVKEDTIQVTCVTESLLAVPAESSCAVDDVSWAKSTLPDPTAPPRMTNVCAQMSAAAS